MKPLKLFFQLLVVQIAVAYGLLLVQTVVYIKNTKFFGDTMLASSVNEATNAYVFKILVIVGLLAAATVWLGYLAYRKRWNWLVWLVVAGEILVILGTLSRFGTMVHVFSGMLTGIVLAGAVTVAGIMAVRPQTLKKHRK